MEQDNPGTPEPMTTGIRQCAALASVAALLTAPTAAQQAPLTFHVTTARPTLECLDTGQQARAHRNRIRTLTVEDGRALAYDQQPPVIAPNYDGTIQLADFTVAGNVATLQFRALDGTVETWTRQRSDTLGGSPVSVFQPSWPASLLDRAMASTRWGWDLAELYIGDVIGAGGLGADRNIFLRIAPLNIPNVQVARVAPDVQYSSHVVNIVLPGFSDEMVQVDDPTTEVVRATTRFYQLFQDTYDAIAVVPQRSLLMPYTGVHYTVKNDVGGINSEQYDESATYGSASGRLRGVEIFPQYFHDNQISTHETAHQWGMYVDWTALTGVARAGHQTDAHDPLWAGYPSRMSSVLDGHRTVVDAGGGAYVVRKSAAAITFPPILRYAMGLLPAAGVPDLVIFDDQAQFTLADPPPPGTPVAGGVKTANMAAVVGLHGERTGPVPTDWSRATIVVSRGGLLSQREMNYWTFYAQRSEDPNRSGIIDFDGYGSFDRATDNLVNFKTDIRPLSGAAIVGPLSVDYPSYGTLDLRGLELNAPLATLSAAGAPITFAGRVTVANRANFNRVAFCLAEEDEASCGRSAVAVSALGGDGGFTASVQPPSAGRYQLLMFLVTPAGGRLTATQQISTFTVN